MDHHYLDSDLEEIADGSRELAEALGSLLVDIASPEIPTGLGAAGRPGRGGGRPSRSAASGQLAAIAPFPELVTLPTTQLHSKLRAISDPTLLRRAHAFEGEQLRRKNVFVWIEDQLRFLGDPLGGPETPIPDFEALSEQEVIAALRYRDSVSFAARVYAWEHYHRRRQALLRAAERICGERGRDLVLRTAPARGGCDLKEPFNGYAGLSTAPHARVELRSRLASCSRALLEQALSYEQGTRRRTTMLEAIEVALRRAPSS